MALDNSQRAGGITSLSEAGAPSGQSEPDKLAQEARFLQQQKDLEEAKKRVLEKHGAALKGLSSDEARTAATGKLIKLELKVIESERAEAPGAPKTGPVKAAAPAKEAGPVTREKPLGILEASQWFAWEQRAYSPEVYLQFVNAFVPELATALADLSTDMQKRTAQMHSVEILFKRLIFTMYLNAHPEFQKSAEDKMAVERELSGWINERWAEVLAAARRLPPTR